MHTHKISHVHILLGETLDTGDNHLRSSGVNDWRCDVFQEAQVAKTHYTGYCVIGFFFGSLYESLSFQGRIPPLSSADGRAYICNEPESLAQPR